VAGELDRGTMELLLSQPVPRNRLILAHFLVDLTVIRPSAAAWCSAPSSVLRRSAVHGDYTQLDKLQEKAPNQSEKPGPPGRVAGGRVRAMEGSMNQAGLLFAVSGLTLGDLGRGRSRAR